MPKTTVAAVIVNWNGREDTLRSLAALTRGDVLPDAILVVDNGSRDGSVDAVREAYPQAEVIVLPENRHFAAGANAGIRRALEAGASYVWILNNDAQVMPGTLKELLRVAESEGTAAGIVGARLDHPDGRSLIGERCDFRRGCVTEVSGADARDADRVDVDYVWACGMLVRAAVLRGVGLFDERLIAYFEDADLCLRARRGGWRTLAAPRAVISHEGSKSANRVYLQKTWLLSRNWLVFFLRHARREDRPGLLAWIVAYRVPRLLGHMARPWLAQWLRAGSRPLRLWSK